MRGGAPDWASPKDGSGKQGLHNRVLNGSPYCINARHHLEPLAVLVMSSMNHRRETDMSMFLPAGRNMKPWKAIIDECNLKGQNIRVKSEHVQDWPSAINSCHGLLRKACTRHHLLEDCNLARTHHQLAPVVSIPAHLQD